MPRRCGACAHAERNALEHELIRRRDSTRTIAARFGLTRRVVERHAQLHLPAALAAAPNAAEVVHGEALLRRVQELYERATVILDRAEEMQDSQAALRAIRESRETLALLARLLGELNDNATVNVAIVHSPEWATVRRALLVALDPFPDARIAVARSLSLIESGGREL